MMRDSLLLRKPGTLSESGGGMGWGCIGRGVGAGKLPGYEELSQGRQRFGLNLNSP